MDACASTIALTYKMKETGAAPAKMIDMQTTDTNNSSTDSATTYTLSLLSSVSTSKCMKANHPASYLWRQIMGLQPFPARFAGPVKVTFVEKLSDKYDSMIPNF